jgi:hypothetical protein
MAKVKSAAGRCLGNDLNVVGTVVGWRAGYGRHGRRRWRRQGNALGADQQPGGENGNGATDDREILVRTISGKPRRRSGIAFGKEAVPVKVSDLTEDELKAICDDDHLIISLSD